MTAYARGKDAFGFCDRCAFRYDLDQLRAQFIDEVDSGLLVCPECMDIDHEQLQLDRVETNDPQSLEDPRPDTSLVESRRLSSWDPVGHVALYATGKVGRVTVVTT
jgi:hypothetical protein